MTRYRDEATRRLVEACNDMFDDIRDSYDPRDDPNSPAWLREVEPDRWDITDRD
jgi:hypothetical protein